MTFTHWYDDLLGSERFEIVWPDGCQTIGVYAWCFDV